MQTKPHNKTKPAIPEGAPVSYDVTTTAGILDVSERTVREWMAKGVLRYAKVGGLVRITPAMIREVLGEVA